MDPLLLLHNTLCGGLAAGGFGVLFNVGYRGLPWCVVSGALAVALRTIALGEGLRLEAASFAAALLLGTSVQLLPSSIGLSRNALHVTGCIPMIPGGFTAKAILGLFAVTAHTPHICNETLVTALENLLHVVFTIGALGTGLAIPIVLLRADSRKASQPEFR